MISRRDKWTQALAIKVEHSGMYRSLDALAIYLFPTLQNLHTIIEIDHIYNSLITSFINTISNFIFLS